MTVELDYIPPTPVYDLEKIQVNNIGWVSTIGTIVNSDLDKIEAAIGGGGTASYETLTNKPQINGITLTGNKTSADLGVQYVLSAGDGIAMDDTAKTIAVAVDGTSVKFNTSKQLESHTSFATISGTPSDNTALTTALNSKVDVVPESIPVALGVDDNGPYLNL